MGPKDYIPIDSIYADNKYYSPVHVQDEANLSEILDRIPMDSNFPGNRYFSPVHVDYTKFNLSEDDQFYPKFSDEINFYLDDFEFMGVYQDYVDLSWQ